MSGRDLIDEMRSGARPLASQQQRGGLFDIVATIAAVVAVGALAFFAYGAWFSDKAPRPPVQLAATPTPAVIPVHWTEADDAACAARGRAAANDPDTGSYMITNDSIAEGMAFLGTKVECQLTSKITHFCGGDGNAELVAIVNDYMGRIDLIRLGLAAQGAPMAIAGGMFGGEAAAGDGIYDSMKADTLAYMKGYDARIVASIRSLATKGVVKADDFKPFPFAGVPSRIEAIFAGAAATSNICG
jgi:hypothetical protein